MCGEKTGNDIISLNQNAIYENCSSMEGNKLKSILHHAIDEGKWIGVRLKGEWLFNWGEKTGNDIIGLNQNAIYENCSSMEGNKLKSILHHAIDEGNWRGLFESGRVVVYVWREDGKRHHWSQPELHLWEFQYIHVQRVWIGEGGWVWMRFVILILNIVHIQTKQFW